MTGWTASRSGACLVLGREPGPLTIKAATALAGALNGWARDAEIYAVTYTPAVMALDCRDLADDAGPALADLIWRLDCFSKPIVSLATGATGDLGLAFALAGTHRVFLTNASCSIQAAARGRLPPGNVLQAVAAIQRDDLRARMLSGDTLQADEAIIAGLATHVIAQDQLSAIQDGLAAADPVDPLLDDRALPPATQPARQGTAPTPPIAAPLQNALAAMRGASIMDALIRACRYDLALLELGPQATADAMVARAATITVTLPERKVLQAFRTASSPLRAG
jgi:enoyl-CoA hydratase/carnithine racemase